MSLRCCSAARPEALAPLALLYGARPNPFAPATDVVFELADAAPVTLRVYGASGRLVSTLVDQTLPSGSHSIDWVPVDQPAGVYFIELRASGTVQLRKATLVH